MIPLLRENRKLPSLGLWRIVGGGWFDLLTHRYTQCIIYSILVYHLLSHASSREMMREMILRSFVAARNLQRYAAAKARTRVCCCCDGAFIVLCRVIRVRERCVCSRRQYIVVVGGVTTACHTHLPLLCMCYTYCDVAALLGFIK